VIDGACPESQENNYTNPAVSTCYFSVISANTWVALLGVADKLGVYHVITLIGSIRTTKQFNSCTEALFVKKEAIVCVRTQNRKVNKK
jgi:hypothetical protein